MLMLTLFSIGRSNPDTPSRLHVAIVLAAAWWYENVTISAQAAVDHAVYVALRPLLGHSIAYWIAEKFGWLAAYLLLDFPVWPIASGYLQTKWNLEIEQANRHYRENRNASPE